MVLGRVAGSRMLLKDTALDISTERARLVGELAARGVDPGRLDFLGSTPWTEHMNAYGGLDIALDPAPQGGGTTTLESIWMGVPVVTLKGKTLCSRGSASALSGGGLGDWIAETAEEYVSMAVEKGCGYRGFGETSSRAPRTNTPQSHRRPCGICAGGGSRLPARCGGSGAGGGGLGYFPIRIPSGRRPPGRCAWRGCQKPGCP